jgi:RimJ/RimL family protein N-acetyltransferase
MDLTNNEDFFEIPNWGGYEYPLACRMLKQTDAYYLYPVMKKSALNLSPFIGWAQYATGWNYKQVTRFVRDHIKSEFPRFHLIFTIGYEVVGFGSLAPMPHYRDIQVALWVAPKHQNRGIGNWIVQVLEWYAFNVFGYDNVYYQCDSQNILSAKIPQKRNYALSHTFDDEKDGTLASGFWFSFKKKRPEGLPAGAIDTGTLENWSNLNFPWKCLI